VILDVDREALVLRIEARATGDGPTLHHTVEFEAEIVMQARRFVLLDDETVALDASLPAARLGGNVELPFLAVDLEAQSFSSRV
jgi:hypothetical protein